MYWTYDLCNRRTVTACGHDFHPRSRGVLMSKRARKRRSRKGNKANHGRKPNA